MSKVAKCQFLPEMGVKMAAWATLPRQTRPRQPPAGKNQRITKQGHSATYNTASRIYVICKGFNPSVRGNYTSRWPTQLIRHVCEACMLPRPGQPNGPAIKAKGNRHGHTAKAKACGCQGEGMLSWLYAQGQGPLPKPRQPHGHEAVAKAVLLASSQVQGNPQGHAAKSCMLPWPRQPHRHSSMAMACCQGHGSPHGLVAKACMLPRPMQTLGTQPRLRHATLEVEARRHGLAAKACMPPR